MLLLDFDWAFNFGNGYSFNISFEAVVGRHRMIDSTPGLFRRATIDSSRGEEGRID
jgi:hypothetical protein